MTKNSCNLPFEVNIGNCISKIKEMRNAMHTNLVALMMNYGVDEVDCTEFDDCPIVFSAFGDECMTLDRITLYEIEGTKYAQLDCSGSYENDTIDVNTLDIDILINVYEWVLDNEEELFSTDEE